MKTNNRYQGDPAIEITPNGASMTFRGGQPVMDQGFHNYVLISLFTKKGWWGNALTSDENKKIGSDFEEQRTIVDLQTINDYRDSVKLSLQSMLDTGIAKTIDVVITNPAINNINASILITPPGETPEQLIFLKNGLNWIAQANNPASERL